MRYKYWVWPEGTVAAEVCDQWVQRYDSKVTAATVDAEGRNDPEQRISETFFASDQDLVSMVRMYTWHANREAFGVDVTDSIECQYTKYNGENNAFYDFHIDSFLHATPQAYDRKLSCIILLTDRSEFEGGELYIGNGTDIEKITLEQGSVIVFPSFLQHRVAPVTSGIRRSMVSWAYGPHWR